MKPETFENYKAQQGKAIFEIAFEGVAFFSSIKHDKMKKQLLKIYNENEPIAKPYTITALTYKIPYILALLPAQRVDAVKIMALLEWVFSQKTTRGTDNLIIAPKYMDEISQIINKYVSTSPAALQEALLCKDDVEGVFERRSKKVEAIESYSFFEFAIASAFTMYEVCTLNKYPEIKTDPRFATLIEKVIVNYSYKLMDNPVPVTKEYLEKTFSINSDARNYTNLLFHWSEGKLGNAPANFAKLVALSLEASGINIALISRSVITKQMFQDATELYSVLCEQRAAELGEKASSPRGSEFLPDAGAFLYMTLRVTASKLEAEIKDSIKYQIFNPESPTKGKTSREEDIIAKLINQAEKDKQIINQLKASHGRTDEILASTKKREAIRDEKLTSAHEIINLLQEKLEQYEAKDIIDNETPPEFALSLDSELLDNLNKYNFDFDESDENEGEQCSQELSTLLEQYKVIFIGGNPNFVNKLRLRQPSIEYILDQKTLSDYTAIRNCAAIFFKTDSMSHSLYEKYKQVAQASGVPIYYISRGSSVSKIENEILQAIELISINSQIKGDKNEQK